MTQDAVDRYFSAVGPLRAEPDELARLDEAAYLKAIGARIFQLRRRLGMTRFILAEQAKISERYVAQLENGRGNVSILVLRALARALGTTPVELLDAEFAVAIGRLAAGLNPDDMEEAHGLLTRHFTARARGGRERRTLLIGLQGAGKRTLGAGLASACGVPFIDLDSLIADAPSRRAVPRGFGLLEQRAIDRAIAENDAAVFTAWAALTATPSSFSQLQRYCRIIWLRAAPEEHLRRAGVFSTLGIRAGKRAIFDLKTILAAHEHMLVRADHVLDTTGLTAAESLDRLIRLAERT